jgi:hypothetical protein
MTHLNPRQELMTIDEVGRLPINLSSSFLNSRSCLFNTGGEVPTEEQAAAEAEVRLRDGHEGGRHRG